jgi:hypothetical protein
MSTTEITLWDVTPNDGSDTFVVGGESKGAAEAVASEWLAEAGEPATMFTVANSGSRGTEPSMGEFVEQRKLSRASRDMVAQSAKVEPREGEAVSSAVKRTAAEKREAKPDPKPSAKRGKASTAKGKATTAKASSAKASTKGKGSTAAAKPATAKATAKPRIGAKAIAIDVLKANGGPMHTRDIVKGILADKRSTGLKGKTPDATIAAMLAVSAKKSDTFKRTEPGTFDLIER